MMDGSGDFNDALTGEQKIRNFNINFESSFIVATSKKREKTP